MDWCEHKHSHELVEYDTAISTEPETYGSSFYLWYLRSEASLALRVFQNFFYYKELIKC